MIYSMRQFCQLLNSLGRLLLLVTLAVAFTAYAGGYDANGNYVMDPVAVAKFNTLSRNHTVVGWNIDNHKPAYMCGYRLHKWDHFSCGLVYSTSMVGWSVEYTLIKAFDIGLVVYGGTRFKAEYPIYGIGIRLLSIKF